MGPGLLRNLADTERAIIRTITNGEPTKASPIRVGTAWGRLTPKDACVASLWSLRGLRMDSLAAIGDVDVEISLTCVQILVRQGGQKPGGQATKDLLQLHRGAPRQVLPSPLRDAGNLPLVPVRAGGLRQNSEAPRGPRAQFSALLCPLPQTGGRRNRHALCCCRASHGMGTLSSHVG